MAEVQNHSQAGEMTQVFIEFVMQQAQNAALFLGQMPDPRRGKVEVNLPLAKMFIDQLAVIRARAAAGLLPDEKKVIDSAVGELAIAYSEVAQLMRAQNLGGEPPPPLMTVAEASALTAPVTAPVSTPVPASAPVAEAAEVAEPPKAAEPEESRKRFTKSYGS